MLKVRGEAPGLDGCPTERPAQEGQRIRMRTAVAAVATCGLALAFAALPGQSVEAAEDFDMASWTLEADCSLCHAGEVASFGSAEMAQAAQAQAAQAADAPAAQKGQAQDAAKGEKPQAGKNVQGAQASGEGSSPQKEKDAPADPAKDAAATDGLSVAQAGMIASIHPDQCTVCHSDTDALTELHVNAKGTARQKSARLKNAVQNETCLACHGSYEELAKATADSTVLTDEQGRTGNPHDIPQVPGHDDPVACTSCHAVHKEYEPMRYCTGCHHEGGFECNTCHAV